MPNLKVWRNGALTSFRNNKMDEHLFLKGQTVISPDGKGEVIDAIGDQIKVKLENGTTRTYLSDDLQDNSSAG